MGQAYGIFLFGAPRIVRDGKPITIETRKALALLAYLILGDANPGGEYSRESLAALLYPDSDQTSARGALRRTLSTLRTALGEGVLLTDRNRVSVRMENLWVDVLVFREKLELLQSHGHPLDEVCSACLPLLQEAVELSGEGFMAGFYLRDSRSFEDWQFFQTEALRQELAGALEKLSLVLAVQGEYDSATRQARRWLALDPLREEAHRRLMLVYAWADQRNAALRQYRECVRILDQELGVSPLEETTQLYQAILENHTPQPPRLAQVPKPLADRASEGEGWVQVSAAHWQPSAPAVSFRGARLHSGGLPLVGRMAEYQALLKAYAATGEKGFVFVLEGEAGIGKTRLALEFLDQIQAAGARVIQARCYEGETGLSYAPFVDSLGNVLASGGAEAALQRVPPGSLSLAAQLLPGLNAFFPGLPPAPVTESPGAQVRFFDALRLMLEALLQGEDPSARGVVFMDDVQWADAASFDLLVYLTRRLRGVFILLAWRSDVVPAGHPLRQLQAQMDREGRSASLALRRLALEEVGELLQAVPGGAELSPEWIRQLYQETEGNPFFVREYLENLLEPAPEAGVASAGERSKWSMPQNVRSLLQARLFKVGEVEQQLLGAAAVLGRTFDFSILRDVSGRSEMEIITGVENLLQHGLITEKSAAEPEPPAAGWVSGEARYDFSHEKLRDLVYEQTSLARRRLLHQRAAEAFSLRGRGRSDIIALAAYHFRLAGQYDLAAAAYRQAGDFARRLYANREAIEHYQNALACGYSQPAALHEAIGDLQALLGRYQLARASYEVAAAQCSPEYLPRIEHKLGNIYHQLGDWDLAGCHYQTALEELDRIDSPGEKAWIFTDWSRTAYRQGKMEQAKDLAAQALQLAESSQDQSALAQAHNMMGILDRASGDPIRALNHLQRSLEIAETLEEPGLRIAALNNLARLQAQSGKIEPAIRLTENALALCLQLNDRHRAAALHNNLADLFHAAGELEKSMEHLRQAVIIFADIGGQAVSPPEKPNPDASSQILGVSSTELRPEIWKLSEW